MIRRWVAAILAAALCTSAAAEIDMPADAAKALHEARHAVLFSLEPWYPRHAQLHPLYQQQELGHLDLSEAQTQVAIQVFESAVAHRSDWDAGCFDPRHAMHIEADGHSFDYLICFVCGQMIVYRDGKVLGKVKIAGSGGKLNEILESASIPVSHSR